MALNIVDFVPEQQVHLKTIGSVHLVIQEELELEPTTLFSTLGLTIVKSLQMLVQCLRDGKCRHPHEPFIRCI